MVAALALAAVLSPTPTPSASPPKTIIDIRASLLCTAMRDNLVRAVEGLRANDAAIDQGRVTLSKMARDSVTGGPLLGARAGRGLSGSLQLDNMQLGQLVRIVAQNLAKIDTALADPHSFPAQPTSADEQMLSAAKRQLEAVADQQRITLNILSGTYETTALKTLLAEGDNTAGALGPNSHSDADVNLDIDPLDAIDPAQAVPSGATASYLASTVTPANSMDPSLFSNNAWGRLSLGTYIQERRTTVTETGVLPTILPIVHTCRQ